MSVASSRLVWWPSFEALPILTPVFRRDGGSDGSEVICPPENLSTSINNGSGSGKTTLLNVLAHREATIGAEVSGRTYVNGAQSNPGDFRKLSSFVEQDDALVGSLTVQETLNFAARLALPRYDRMHECGVAKY